MRLARRALTAAALVAFAAAALAARQPADAPDALDVMIDNLYAAVSGPVGQERDWELMDSVFAADAAMIALNAGADGTVSHQRLSPQTYREKVGPALARIGFRETETRRAVTRHGRSALIASEYASFRGDEAEPFDRGVNFIHAALLDGSWRVISISWQRTSNPADADPLFP